MDRNEIKSSKEWQKEIIEFCKILDPDGWDRQNLDESWNENITKKEFMRRLVNSTIQANLEKLGDWGKK